MTQTRAMWIAGSIIMLALAALSLFTGVALMPQGTVAIRDGKMIPWLLTWGMIWTTTVAAIVVATFLAMVGAGKVRGVSFK